MNKRMVLSRILCIVELVVTIVPVGLALWAFTDYDSQSAGFPGVLVDTALILPTIGSGLAALGACLGRSRYRAVLCGTLALTVCGLTALILILVFSPGYFDFEAANLPWWVCVVFTYPVGVIVSCVGAVLVLVESFAGQPAPKDNVERNVNYPTF